jgi:diadenylate cyclase
VTKFAVHLPLAEHYESYKHLGTRHRSALGLSQRTDAFVIVVSEERGTISIAHRGVLSVISDREVLQNEIEKFLAQQPAQKKWYRWFTQNIALKISALGLAIILWLLFVYGNHIVQ